jgi:FtsZ-interacting cell division protein ZipA
MVNLLIAVGVLVLVVVIVRGFWRATAAQKGTGCPCCDKLLGADPEHEHEHSSSAAGKPPEGAGSRAKS